MFDLLHSSEADNDWYRDGLCLNEEDPDLFFPVGSPGNPAYDRQVEVAQSICARCPVKTDCLLWAVESFQEHGIWGGTEENQRMMRIRAARQAGNLATNRYATNMEVSAKITQAIEDESARLRKLAERDAEAHRRKERAA